MFSSTNSRWEETSVLSLRHSHEVPSDVHLKPVKWNLQYCLQMIKVDKSQDELWYIDQGLLEEASLMFL